MRRFRTGLRRDRSRQCGGDAAPGFRRRWQVDTAAGKMLSRGDEMRTSRSRLALTVAVLVLVSGCEFGERMHMKRGNELYTAQKYEEAIVEYDKITAVNPKHWKANYLTAVSYMALYHPNSEH